jgi:translation initiation factor eIF-2B subunit alpha
MLRKPSMPMTHSPLPQPLEMTVEQIQNNPMLDFTTPDLIKVVVSDTGACLSLYLCTLAYQESSLCFV